MVFISLRSSQSPKIGALIVAQRQLDNLQSTSQLDYMETADHDFAQ